MGCCSVPAIANYIIYTIIGKLQLLALTGASGWLGSVSRISLKCHYAVTTMSMRTLPRNGFKAITGNLYTWYQHRSQQGHLPLRMNHCVGMPQCLLREYHFSSVTLGRQHPACCITKNQYGTVRAQSSKVLIQLSHCQVSNFCKFTSLQNHKTTWSLFTHDHLSSSSPATTSRVIQSQQ